MFLIQSQSKLLLRKASCFVFLTVLLCLLCFEKKEVKFTPISVPLLAASDAHRCQRIGVSDAHRLRTLLAVSSFQMWSVGRMLVQP